LKKIIIFTLLPFAVLTCNNNSSLVKSYKYVEPITYPSEKNVSTAVIGIESIDVIDKKEGLIQINIFCLNPNPVAGFQFNLEPKGFIGKEFEVFAGRAESKGFTLNGKNGKVLGFSMTGALIPKAQGLNVKENILVSIKGKLSEGMPEKINLDQLVLASPKAKKMASISLPFILEKSEKIKK